MEYLLSSQPLFKSRREENIKPKKKILFKFKIIEDEKSQNHLRNNYFIKCSQITDISNIKQKKTNDNLPLINIKENKTLLNTKLNEDNKVKNLKLRNVKYKSKDEIIKSTMLPYTRMKSPLNNKKSFNNNICFTEMKNKRLLFKKISIKDNSTQTKKGNSIYDDLLENEEKNDLKLIKLNRINDNTLDISKKNLYINNINRYKEKENNNEEDTINNPIKIIIESDNNNNDATKNSSKKDKIILGSKYSTYNISPDSAQKNLFYSRLNTYYNKLNEKNKNSEEKKINLSKLDFQKIKLKSYHNQKMKKCKQMIIDTVKEVNGVKNYCLNWVNELREQYSDLYKGCGIENKEDI